MNNVEIIKKAYQDFATGNMAEVMAIMDENIVWNTSTGWPSRTSHEPIEGATELEGGVFQQIAGRYNNFRIEVNELFGVDDKVVMEGYYAGTWKDTGKQFRANAVDIWHLKDGKIVRYFQAVDTAEIMYPKS